MTCDMRHGMPSPGAHVPAIERDCTACSPGNTHSAIDQDAFNRSDASDEADRSTGMHACEVGRLCCCCYSHTLNT